MLVVMPILADDGDHGGIAEDRHGKIGVNTLLPLQIFLGDRVVTEIWQAEFFEWDMREIKRLRAAAIGLAEDTVLVILARGLADTALSLGEQLLARTEDDCFCGTDGRTCRFFTDREPLFAKLALDDFWVPTFPLELGNVIGAGDLAVAAAHALGTGPADYTVLRILGEGLEGAAGDAGGIDAMHALLLHE